MSDLPLRVLPGYRDYLVAVRDDEHAAARYARDLWRYICEAGTDEELSVFSVGPGVWVHVRSDDERLRFIWIRNVLGGPSHGQS